MEINAALLEKAILFATEKHKSQTRKGNGMPYILHPIIAMTTFLSIKDSNNAILSCIVLLLHDVVEDCDVTLEEIARLFGHKVAALVEELTSDEERIKEIGKTEYLKEKMVKMSSYSLRFKLIDRLVNIKDMVSMNDSFRKKQIASTTEILEHIEANRKLTDTHKKIIKLIRKEMKVYEPKLMAA